MTPEQHRIRREQAIADAAMLGDPAALAKHGISQRTLTRYRASARRDPSLAGNVLSKVEAAQSLDWLRTAEKALDDMTQAVQETVARMGRKRRQTPEELHAMCGALKIVSEAVDARSYLMLRLAPPGSIATRAGA
jgi:hypothetical protein